LLQPVYSGGGSCQYRDRDLDLDAIGSKLGDCTETDIYLSPANCLWRSEMWKVFMSCQTDQMSSVMWMWMYQVGGRCN